jgi:hypothetical protein
MKRRLRSRLIPGLFLLLVLVALVWGSDRITLQGERTIYTVDCAKGSWDGSRCTGYLVPGPRYAFRASPRRHEVIFWIRDSEKPSETLTDCTVKNRDNWSCNAQVGQSPAAAYEMRDGIPTHGLQGLTIQYHEVSKWKWWAIKYGAHMFNMARG